MSLSRPGHEGGAAHAARTIVQRVKRERPPAASRPGRKPSPGSNSGQPASGGGDGTATSETPVAGAPSTDPFHEHEAPPPDPFQGPGGFDPGTPGGKGPSAGGSGKVSPAPEPGSILLFGTGLLGVLGVMRQRRLI